MITTARRTSSASTVLRVVSVLATLTVLHVVVQYVTAGTLVSRTAGLEDIHETGAIVLHVLSGLTTIAALLLFRAAKGAIWPTVLSAVVFVFSFVPADTGGRSTLYLHISVAMLRTVGAVWVMAWSFSLSPSRAAAR